eukprot:COSAG06_NODE_1710_length_8634_cov_767.811365_1_plen_172_part_00
MSAPCGRTAWRPRSHRRHLSPPPPQTAALRHRTRNKIAKSSRNKKILHAKFQKYKRVRESAARTHLSINAHTCLCDLHPRIQTRFGAYHYQQPHRVSQAAIYYDSSRLLSIMTAATPRVSTDAVQSQTHTGQTKAVQRSRPVLLSYLAFWRSFLPATPMSATPPATFRDTS